MTNPLSTFQAAIPGSSLTKEFGSMPHQKPPEIVDPEQAKDRIWKEINRPVVLQNIWHLAENGMPAFNIALIILYKACLQSLFTIDVAVIIAPIVTSMIAVVCKEQGIEPKIVPEIKTATDAILEADALRKVKIGGKKTEEIPAEAAPEEAQPTGLMGNIMSKAGEV